MIRRTRVVLLATMLGATSLAFEAVRAAESEEGGESPGIVFEPLERAVKSSVETKRVLVVYFTSKTCGYCRKMESVTFRDTDVIGLSKRFVWTRVDVDEKPLIAALFGLSGVPAIALLNVESELLELRGGYVVPTAMVNLLKETADKAEAPGKGRKRLMEVESAADRLKAARTAGELEAAVGSMVAILALPERRGREEARKSLLAAGSRIWPGLLARLADRRLAIRAAAYDVLTESTRETIAFDPFAPEEVRTRQMAAWKAWLEKQAPRGK